MTPQEEALLFEAFDLYGDVYRVNICNIDFFFRLPSREEFEVFMTSSPDGFEFEDNISRLCTIIPQDFDFANCKAGIPAMLCVTILQLAGYGGDNAAFQLQQARSKMELLENQMDAVIMTAFPQYKDDELRRMTRPRQFELYAKAEWALRELRGITLSDILNPEPAGNPLPPPPTQLL